MHIKIKWYPFSSRFKELLTWSNPKLSLNHFWSDPSMRLNNQIAFLIVLRYFFNGCLKKRWSPFLIRKWHSIGLLRKTVFV